MTHLGEEETVERRCQSSKFCWFFYCILSFSSFSYQFFAVGFWRGRFANQQEKLKQKCGETGPFHSKSNATRYLSSLSSLSLVRNHFFLLLFFLIFQNHLFCRTKWDFYIYSSIGQDISSFTNWSNIRNSYSRLNFRVNLEGIWMKLWRCAHGFGDIGVLSWLARKL